jgi:hypothetical protein
MFVGVQMSLPSREMMHSRKFNECLQGDAMENDKTGSRRIWLGFIGGGILATALGFCALDLAPAASSAPVFGVMLLLTGGMVSCLAGAVGMAGMLAWIPGMDGEQERRPMRESNMAKYSK